MAFAVPGPATRLLVEQHFNISVQDQIEIETYLDSLDSIQPLWHPRLERFFNDDCTHYFDNYVTSSNLRLRADFRFPHVGIFSREC
jgi:hypothetical protein